MKWILLMSWRLSKKSRSKLFLFSLSIVLGTAAYVAIEGFQNNIKDNISGEAKELLGADFQLWSHQPFNDSTQIYLDSLEAEEAQEQFFSSMITLPEGDVRLAQIHAVQGGYPFYGNFETTPESAATTFKSKRAVLVDETLMLQYQLQVGDSIKIGNSYFILEGELNKVPRQASATSIFAPAVYIPLQHLADTDLIKEGSRVIYYTYLKLKNPALIPATYDRLKEPLDLQNVEIDSYQTRQKRFGKAFGLLGNYLNLIAFVALLLGGLGISGAVQTFTKQLRSQIATLKCLGVSGNKIVYIFALQLFTVSVIGAISGIILGTGIQVYLPSLFKDFIPVSVDFEISYAAMLKGGVLSCLLALFFSLPVLIQTKYFTALEAIQNRSNSSTTNQKLVKLFYGVLFLFIYLFCWLQLGSALQSLIFCIGLGILLLILWLSSSAVLKFARGYSKSKLAFIIRQGISNLHRPNNQTALMVISLGLGITIIATLFNVQQFLVSELSIQNSPDRPNLILFDIRKEQRNKVQSLMDSLKVEVKEETPVVAMRLEAIKGMRKKEISEIEEIPDHIMDREYRTTFRDYLTDSEVIAEGEWIPEIKDQNNFSVSISQNLAQDMKAKVGDRLTFNIQGLRYDVKISSIRKVKWASFNTNFTVVFPKGFLEKAPQVLAFTAKAPDNKTKAQFQRQLVGKFPNISSLDLDRVIDSLGEVIDKIIVAIQFLAYFSLITGIVVLISSINNTRLLRLNENALFRTIGATSKVLNRINLTEFILLGFIASFLAVLLSMLVSWLLGLFAFNIAYQPSALINGSIFLIGVILISLTGFFSNRINKAKSPLDTLREE